MRSVSVCSTIVVTGVLLLFNLSCKKNSAGPAQPDVFVAGSAVSRAVYWQNGKIHYLTDTTIGQWSYAGHIGFSGSDMYMAGTMATSPNFNMTAVYWKNGVMTRLPSTMQSQAGYILLSGNDVYVSGDVFSYDAEFGFAAYWKNGNVTVLSQDTSGAAGMFMNGSDLYIAGSERIKGVSYPTIWKNGIAMHLAHDTGGAAVSIAFSGTDMYVAGVLQINNRQTGVYWKNGTPTTLGPVISVNSLDVWNGDVYVSGWRYTDSIYNDGGVYWKNGSPMQLPNSTLVNAMCISGGNVYLAGDLEQKGGSSHAAYWKNGQPTDLNPDGHAYDIEVRP
ncbi:MAG TPA: hypothetical protein VHE54_17055 [Puia sp.]|nr:hypothetical protein [Puia sp.]